MTPISTGCKLFVATYLVDLAKEYDYGLIYLMVGCLGLVIGIIMFFIVHDVTTEKRKKEKLENHQSVDNVGKFKAVWLKIFKNLKIFYRMLKSEKVYLAVLIGQITHAMA